MHCYVKTSQSSHEVARQSLRNPDALDHYILMTHGLIYCSHLLLQNKKRTRSRSILWITQTYTCMLCTSKSLCGRPIGHNMHLAQPSVCLSLCPVCARNSKTKKRRKNKMAQTFPRARVSQMPIFRWKGQMSRPRDIKNHRKLVSCLLRCGDQAQVDPVPTAN